MGGGPKVVAPPPPPPPPTPEDPNVAAKMNAAADAEKKIQGRASTYLTNPSLLGSASVTKRSLLGS